jgi:hypothetical protein
MKSSFFLLPLVPALLLTSCYVTPDGGPYSSRPGYRAPAHPGHRDDHRYDHGRDRRDYGRDGRVSDRGRDRWDGRDDRRSPGYRGGAVRETTTTVVTLPRGSRRVMHSGTTYYTHGSTWYRSSGSGYVRVTRPY